MEIFKKYIAEYLNENISSSNYQFPFQSKNGGRNVFISYFTPHSEV